MAYALRFLSVMAHVQQGRKPGSGHATLEGPERGQRAEPSTDSYRDDS